MKITEIQPGKKYTQTKSSDDRIPGTSIREKKTMTVYVLKVDLVNNRVLCSYNLAPAEWVSAKTVRYWSEFVPQKQTA